LSAPIFAALCFSLVYSNENFIIQLTREDDHGQRTVAVNRELDLNLKLRKNGKLCVFVEYNKC
jgi:hypothetical protein